MLQHYQIVKRSPKNEISFIKDLESVINGVCNINIFCIAGDFNAKIGSVKNYPKNVGFFGKDTLLDLVIGHNFCPDQFNIQS